MVSSEKNTDRSVLVIGAGIAGSTAALSLGQAGCKVYLIERQAVIGGHAAKMGCKASTDQKKEYAKPQPPKEASNASKSSKNKTYTPDKFHVDEHGDNIVVRGQN